MSLQRKERVGTWIFQFVAQNIWKIYYDSAGTQYIAQTGSDVTKELSIPWSHRWNSIHFRHANSANADAVTVLKVIVRRPTGKNVPATFQEDMFYDDSVMVATVSENFGEMFEREASVYNVVTNTTSTDRVTPVFYVQKLDGGA